MSSDLPQQLALNTAISFRLGMEAQASEGLVVLIDVLAQMLQASCAIAPAQLDRLFAAMLAAQARKDFSYLADLLQYELVPLLNGAAASSSAVQ